MAEEAAKRAKEAEGKGKRAQRATSNVFAAFSQNQIQEFKEAFSLVRNALRPYPLLIFLYSYRGYR